VSGPLKTVEFIAKVARAGGQRDVTRPPMLGIRHVALYVADLEAAERFWVDVMGYAVEWRPDPDNVYLHGARDNLALHRKAGPARAASTTSGSPSPRPETWTRGRLYLTSQNVAAEDAAQDPPRRLAIEFLLPRPRVACSSQITPPLADGLSRGQPGGGRGGRCRRPRRA
jgi:catechol 2,3-dioxygenase-like lactoylglutathione lyase family enzyme